jgi:hypothetical protein
VESMPVVRETTTGFESLFPADEVREDETATLKLLKPGKELEGCMTTIELLLCKAIENGIALPLVFVKEISDPMVVVVTGEVNVNFTTGFVLTPEYANPLLASFTVNESEKEAGVVEEVELFLLQLIIKKRLDVSINLCAKFFIKQFLLY